MGARSLAGQAAYLLRRTFSTPQVLSPTELASELGRRLGTMPRKKAAALVAELASSLPDEVAAYLVTRFDLTVPMEYDRHPIRLTLSSDALGNRIRAAAKEPFTVAWIEEKLRPGDVFWDVGANVGPYALIAAKTCPEASIVAIEPAAANYYDLCRNIVLNGCENVITPVPVALWAETALIPFAHRTLRPGDAQHAAGDPARPGAAYTQQLLAFSVDDLVNRLGLPIPVHAKIDVDGPELQVLDGGRESLSSGVWRSLLIEIDATGGTEHERLVCARLEEHGFEAVARHERAAPGAPVYRSFERRS